MRVASAALALLAILLAAPLASAATTPAVQWGAPFGSIPKPQLETGVKRKIPATACTCNSTGKDYNGPVEFSERGSHSEDWNIVRSYSIKLNDTTKFLGMPKGQNWALYGPQNDTMGFHDWFGFYLYRLTGNYAARTQYIELFVTDGLQPVRYPDDYLGLYLSMEHIDVGKDRVDIAKPTDADVTGGYILDNEHGKTKQGLVELPPLNSTIQYMLEYPTKPTQAMHDYILGYLNKFEATLFGPQYADPQSGWRSLANESSAIDYFLFQARELIKSNNNGYRGSQRLYKDAKGPLNFGPPWDFNVNGYQNGGVSNGSSGGSAISPEGWSFNICEQPERCTYDPVNGISVWYRSMWQEPAFKAAVARRFQQLRSTVWTDAALTDAVRNIQGYIHDAAMRSFSKWPADFFNPYAPLQPTAGKSRLLFAVRLQGEAQLQATADKLIQWTTTRLAWMGAQLQPFLSPGQPADASHSPVASPANSSIAGGPAANASTPNSGSAGGSPETVMLLEDGRN
ncbi:hypothetical protein N2152v2_008770 [Parachlorella kessleri]